MEPSLELNPVVLYASREEVLTKISSSKIFVAPLQHLLQLKIVVVLQPSMLPVPTLLLKLS
jgi:hypothetical protein